MNPITLSHQAERFARERHKGLTRPNKAQQPCVEHLREVAELAQAAGCSEEAIAAAWLHDSVEDTATTREEIRDLFGEAVYVLVDGLTDPDGFAELPLLERKTKQAERLATKTGELLLVKLSDQISNTRSVLLDPPCDWSAQKALDYVDGARAIALVCRGASPRLDALFDEAYAAAAQKYAPVPNPTERKSSLGRVLKNKLGN
jgi:(p)ppGpp synthase/HD superfamily hydrolase